MNYIEDTRAYIFIERIFYKLDNIKYSIRNLLFKRFDLIPTGLSKSGYHDKPELILHGMMRLIVDYVEVEKCFERIEWESDPDHSKVAKDIKEIYAWWKDYPNRQKEINIALDNWHSLKYPEGHFQFDTLNINGLDDTEEMKRYFKLHYDMEEQLEKEAEMMLMKIIKIRNYLWT